MVYGGSGALTILGGECLRRQIEPVAISTLEFEDIIELDELPFIYGRHRAEKLSDYTMYTSVGLMTLLLARPETRRDFGKISLLLGETMLINAGLTNLSKAIFRRPRPYVFDPAWDANRTVNSSDRSSLLSGHTSGAAAGSFFFARVFADYYPDSKLKSLVWGTAIALPALTGYLRVRAAKHYPSDVIAGYALGAAVGYLVPTLHKKPLLKGKLVLAPSVAGFNATLSLQ